MTKKSLLIKDTTVDERMAIVKESLNFCDGDCDGVDMDDMYDDYIFGRRELADINLEFSRKHAGEVCQTVLRHLAAAWDGNHLHWHEKTDCQERCWLRTIRFFYRSSRLWG